MVYFFAKHAPITPLKSGRAGRDTPKTREIARPRRAIQHAPGVLHNPRCVKAP